MAAPVEPGVPALGAAGAVPLPIAEVDAAAWAPAATHVGELDRVLQGGLVPGSVTCSAASRASASPPCCSRPWPGWPRPGQRCLYVTAEESAQQVRLRAERLGALPPNLWLVSDTALPHVLAHIDAVAARRRRRRLDPDGVRPRRWARRPARSPRCASARTGSCALAKERAMSSVLVGHVTKEGALAGPRVLEHLVDTVLSFEGERHHALRLLRAVKHRFGSTDELGLFEMTDAGLDGRARPVGAVPRRPAARHARLGGRARCSTGTGRCSSRCRRSSPHPTLPTPRRSAQGLDSGRLALVLAVLQQHVQLPFDEHDVHTVVAGGVTAVEPGADLALALALASARTGRRRCPPTSSRAARWGSAASCARCTRPPAALGEAARLGFRRAVVPASAPLELPGIEVLRVAHARAGRAARVHGRARGSASAS